MLCTLLATCLIGLVSVQCFKITARVDSTEEPEVKVSSLHTYQTSLDPPYPDHTVYEAIFAGVKNPITVDCTQPGVVCKFPLVVANKELYSKPVKNVKEVPIIKGLEVSNDDISKAAGREDIGEREDLVVVTSTDKQEDKMQVNREFLDIESIVADRKDVEDSWILEKNILNKKYQIPVKLVPSSPQHDHGSAPVYPVHHDFHDHFSGGDPYHFPPNRHGSGWTPWMRAYPSVYHYPSNQPCQPPVYHHPPSCNPAVTPTKKPTINIDDKIDKEED